MLTVLVATRNGAETWPMVLDAYVRVDAPQGGWKLVVVDNASTDRTSDIVQSFRHRLPLTYVFEAQDGKNTALNSALTFASGDLVVFSDDDAIPRSDWLTRLREAADSRLDFDIFGGRVIPRWQATPSALILNAVPQGAAFAISDPQLKEGPIDATQVFGPNMAIRTGIFKAGHRFDTTIGPRRGGNYAMGSETELVMRLIKRGARAWHVHGAVVEHFIRTRQLEPSWIIQRAHRFGRGQYRLAQIETAQAIPNWFCVPRYAILQLARTLASIVEALLQMNSRALFRSRWQLSYWWGHIMEARNLPSKRP